MITIDAYLNKSENNSFTKDITLIGSLSGTLKAETSIIDPVFIIQAEMGACVGCNYIDIPSFGRKYFVNNIRSIRTGIVEFQCHVDVLSSFKDQILSNKAIIKKQENKNNLYLDDGSLKVYSKPLSAGGIVTKKFPSGFSGHSYIFIVAG